MAYLQMAAVPHIIVDDGGEEASAVDACTTTERSFQGCDGVQGGQSEMGGLEEQRAESRQTRLQPIRVVDQTVGFKARQLLHRQESQRRARVC